MAKLAQPRSSPQRIWSSVAATALVAIAFGAVRLAARTPPARGARAPALPVDWTTSDATIPDDAVLLEQLERAVDLRRREDFDRMGTLDYGAVAGVDPDLTIRPFGWKGHQATLRDMAEESLHLHQGLRSNRIQLAVRDGSLPARPYGNGPWYDVDGDGVSLEIHEGMLTTVVAYLAQLEVPTMRPPRDPGLVDAWAAGRSHFDEIGCAACHVPTLELEDTKLDARQDPNRPAFVIDVGRDGDGPKIEPKYAGDKTPYLVHLFSDLKRHDVGAALATPSAQGTIPAQEFLTRPLWGLAETAPYLHDGRAPTVHDAIVLHGGEASAARDAYLALAEDERASVRVFLMSLSREPKLFVP